ncbi:MAG TPA: phosphohistidine phosphatase SixA [Thermoleophilia bacterium]|nr:phosphohistidine phosphatase SixA [Thermoleophilia bacterium]
MTRVYFLRHGKAENRAEWRGSDDERPLTAEGEEAMRREAEALRALGLAPDVIVTSPLARARRTAEIVAEGLGLSGRLVEDERLAHGFDVRRLEQVLTAHAGAGAVMVVGHEPDFSAAVAELIGGGEIVMKKGGLARVDVTAPAAGGGELVWLLTPPLLGSR